MEILLGSAKIDIVKQRTYVKAYLLERITGCHKLAPHVDYTMSAPATLPDPGISIFTPEQCDAQPCRFLRLSTIVKEGS